MVPVATGDIVMRMMVERALQPEIAAVAGELLRFDGSEFRFRRWYVSLLVCKRIRNIFTLYKYCP